MNPSYELGIFMGIATIIGLLFCFAAMMLNHWIFRKHQKHAEALKELQRRQQFVQEPEPSKMIQPPSNWPR